MDWQFSEPNFNVILFTGLFQAYKHRDQCDASIILPDRDAPLVGATTEMAHLRVSKYAYRIYYILDC